MKKTNQEIYYAKLLEKQERRCKFWKSFREATSDLIKGIFCVVFIMSCIAAIVVIVIGITGGYRYEIYGAEKLKQEKAEVASRYTSFLADSIRLENKITILERHVLELEARPPQIIEKHDWIPRWDTPIFTNIIMTNLDILFNTNQFRVTTNINLMPYNTNQFKYTNSNAVELSETYLWQLNDGTSITIKELTNKSPSTFKRVIKSFFK